MPAFASHLPLLVRSVLLTVLLAVAPGSVSAARTVELEQATVVDLQAAFAAGTLTAERLVELSLRRIEAYDERGPALNAVLALNPDALRVARELDRERRERGPRSLLHGIPVVLKDNFDTFDLPTTGGSPVFSGKPPAHDAFVVEKLRRSGAIILAKVNLSGFMGTRRGVGDSMTGGQTLNPYNLAHHPGGSSGGTGVAVAAWFASAGLGTETGVSIRDPSSNNALVGIAATEGLISRSGVLPLSFVHDRAGPMARSVTDAAAMLSVVAGIDPTDLYTLESAGRVPSGGYTPFLDPQGLQGARIGVLVDLFSSGPEHEEGLALIEKALADLTAAGAFLIRPVTLGIDLRSVLRWSRSTNLETRFALDAYFRRRGPDSPVKTLADYIEAGQYYPESKAGLVRALAIESLDTHPAFASLMTNRRVLRDLAERLMDQYQLDALVYPMKTFPAARIPKEPGGELRPANADNPFSSITGLPAIVVPAGFDSNNLPVALEFLGRRFSEPTLIRLAYSYEQKTRHRRPPATTPRLDGETIPIP
jgi:amidase